jgi:hypothetical protein
MINVICDNALLTGFAADQRPVEAETVREVCRDFDFGAEGGLPAMPARVPNPPVQHRLSWLSRAKNASFQLRGA